MSFALNMPYITALYMPCLASFYRWHHAAHPLSSRKTSGRTQYARITVHQYEGESTSKWEMVKLPFLGQRGVVKPGQRLGSILH